MEQLPNINLQNPVVSTIPDYSQQISSMFKSIGSNASDVINKLNATKAQIEKEKRDQLLKTGEIDLSGINTDELVNQTANIPNDLKEKVLKIYKDVPTGKRPNTNQQLEINKLFKEATYKAIEYRRTQSMMDDALNQAIKNPDKYNVTNTAAKVKSYLEMVKEGNKLPNLTNVSENAKGEFVHPMIPEVKNIEMTGYGDDVIDKEGNVSNEMKQYNVGKEIKLTKNPDALIQTHIVKGENPFLSLAPFNLEKEVAGMGFPASGEVTRTEDISNPDAEGYYYKTTNEITKILTDDEAKLHVAKTLLRKLDQDNTQQFILTQKEIYQNNNKNKSKNLQEILNKEGKLTPFEQFVKEHNLNEDIFNVAVNEFQNVQNTRKKLISEEKLQKESALDKKAALVDTKPTTVSIHEGNKSYNITGIKVAPGLKGTTPQNYYNLSTGKVESDKEKQSYEVESVDPDKGVMLVRFETSTPKSVKGDYMFENTDNMKNGIIDKSKYEFYLKDSPEQDGLTKEQLNKEINKNSEIIKNIGIRSIADKTPTNDEVKYSSETKSKEYGILPIDKNLIGKKQPELFKKLKLNASKEPTSGELFEKASKSFVLQGKGKVEPIKYQVAKKLASEAKEALKVNKFPVKNFPTIKDAKNAINNFARIINEENDSSSEEDSKPKEHTYGKKK